MGQKTNQLDPLYEGPDFKKESRFQPEHRLFEDPAVKRLYEHGPEEPAYAFERTRTALQCPSRFYLQVPAHEVDPDDKRNAYQAVANYVEDKFPGSSVHYLRDTDIIGLAQHLGVPFGKGLDEMVRGINQALPILGPILALLLYNAVKQDVPRAELVCQNAGDLLIPPRESGLSAPYCQADPNTPWTPGMDIFTEPIIRNQAEIDGAKAHNLSYFWKAVALALSTSPAFIFGNSVIAQKLRGLIGDEKAEEGVRSWFAFAGKVSNVFHSGLNYGNTRYAIFEINEKPLDTGQLMFGRDA